MENEARPAARTLPPSRAGSERWAGTNTWEQGRPRVRWGLAAQPASSRDRFREIFIN